MRVADPQAAADGRPQRHDGGAAHLLEAEGQHRIVGGVGQDDEAVVGQLLGRRQQLDRVGQQGPVVADHLELDPVGAEGLPGQLGREHGLAGGGAAGGVGQHPHPELVEQVEQRAPARGIDPAHGHGGHGGARRDQGLAQRRQAGHPAGAQQQPRGQALARRCRGPRVLRVGASDAMTDDDTSSITDRTARAGPARYRGRVPTPATPPVALTIAGSDSGGGAGVQADLKTFAAHGVHGTTALTAVTAQNTAEVRGVVVLEPGLRPPADRDGARATSRCASVKTGMLATRAIVDVVADLAAAGRLPQLVVDPVLVSSQRAPAHGPRRGRGLSDPPPPARRWWSPPTCARPAALTGTAVDDLLTRGRHGRGGRADPLAAGPRYVVVKGGHLTDVAHDVVAGPDGITVLEAARVATGNDHGTGCSLSAAIAAHLALGADVLAPSRRPRRSWPAGWPGGPPGSSGRGTGPSTISGGLRRRRLERS